MKTLKKIQGVRAKRSISYLIESSRPIPNLFKEVAWEWLMNGYRAFYTQAVQADDLLDRGLNPTLLRWA